jgi:adenine-specific DNA methylase
MTLYEHLIQGDSNTMTVTTTTPVLEHVTPEHQRAFIEVQFPVAKLSVESYKERKAGSTQTLTGLGKWWGRKPLALVRAIVLGLLMPASSDPDGDIATFLALMTMDEDGLRRRRTKALSAKEVEAILPPRRTDGYIEDGKWLPGVHRVERARLQEEAFSELPYEEKLAYCVRPEEIDGPSPEAWQRINAHLGTSASSLPDLVRELGKRRYGHVPTVGDAFCGGGSIPFEAARIGCDVYASDINPVAGLLTWAALNIVGGGEQVVAQVRAAQQQVYDAVRAQVDAWGIERNEQGWIAEAYLYCNEVRDPRTGWLVPLAPSWVIATRNNVVAKLVPDPGNKRFEIAIETGVSAGALKRAADDGTWRNGVVSPVNRTGDWLEPHQRTTTSVEQLRGANGLRRWENDDLVPRPDGVFQERLYCIRWRDPKTGERYYRAPTEADLRREERVLALLRERFADWQAQGFIPSREIEPGNKTEEPIRTRGWTHWHHLFNPRQLLLLGALSFEIARRTSGEGPSLLLSLGKSANWDSRLSRWNSHPSKGQPEDTFYNQALNTLVTYALRPSASLDRIFCAFPDASIVAGSGAVALGDARSISYPSDVWITDPGYGDAVNYDEISEFFLAWYDKRLPNFIPDWYADSRRVLNIKGEGEQFRLGLTEAYSNLTRHMPDDGYQVIMFTHQDASLWAEVGLTIWAAGLQVVTAWTIATETGATGLRQGNYVQGTVCLVLRKRVGHSFGYLSDIYPEVEQEVKTQLETMRALDDDADPSFGDADYQLAAYAAALRVLTSYSEIDEIDIKRELSRPRTRGEASPITRLIDQAVDIATNVMVPRGLEQRTWRRRGPSERLYLKAIEIEARGESREGIYQELARSFGATDARDLYASTRANQVRFKTPSEFRARNVADLGGEGFAGSFLRRVLRAVFETAEHEDGDPRPARQRLAVEFGAAYWQERERMVELLRFLRRHSERLPHWERDNAAIDRLIGSLESHRL